MLPKGTLLCTLVVVCASFFSKPASSQTIGGVSLDQPERVVAPARDAVAVALVQKSIAMMGGAVPVDSTATGEIVFTEGGISTRGQVRVLTRGDDQCAEHVQLPDEQRSRVYSRGEADERSKGVVKASSLELASSSQCAEFPLAFLGAALRDSEMTVEYVTDEGVQGAAAQHIRFWNAYSSRRRLQILSEFTRRDVWLNAATGLPERMAYERREGHGTVAGVRIEVVYSDWRKVGGFLYPFKVEKYWNGVPWSVTTMQQVAFSTGVPGTEFALQPRKEAK